MITSAVLLPILAAVAHAADHLIVVGGPGVLAYTPSNITANIGDTITFQFQEKNHTVTQAAFASPCSPLKGADGSFIGFNSGFMPVPAGTTSGFPSYTVTVNDTNPIWAYCQQQGPPIHCQAGMVFSANAATEGNTFDAFKAAAIASGSSNSSASSSSAWTSPPAPVIATVTATVTAANSVYTTTYASWEGASPNPTPDPQPSVIKVVVGGTAGLVFTPPNVVAAIGDVVSFVFNSKNHTVTQSLFNSPCTKATDGFDSGFMPVDANATTFPTFNVTVNVSTPIWGYCRQQGPPIHCQQGMVFGINPPTAGANTFEAFQQLAEHINATNITSSGNTTGSTNSTGSGGSQPSSAGRAAVSAGLSMGAIAVVVAAFL